MVDRKIHITKGRFIMQSTLPVPQNPEAEKCLLALLYYKGSSCKSMIESIHSDDFFDKKNGILFDILRDSISQNEQLDYVTLKGKLDQKGHFLDVGGKQGLADIFRNKPECTDEEAAKKADEYQKLIRETARKRHLIAIAESVAQKAMMPESESGEILGQAEEKLGEIATTLDSGKRTAGATQIMLDVFDKINAYAQANGKLLGLPTGFRDVDGMLLGLQPSDLIIIAARPSMGKTAFAMNIAEHVAVDLKKPVLVFSMEMSSVQIGFRMLCSLGMLDSKRLRMGKIDEADCNKIVRLGEFIADSPLIVNDTGGLTISEVRRIAREEKAKHNIELIVIDYIQLMAGENKRDGRTQEVSEISRGLKAMAKELNVPVIALSQLSRAVETRVSKRPMLSDLRESGSIEQDADVVMFLYREAYYKKDEDGVTDADMDAVRDKAQVIISKNRNGEIGDVNLKFISSYTKFMDLDQPQVVK
jgi:replicative DNA helicase